MIAAIAATLAAIACGAAQAAETFPAKPIRLIAPFPPGGPGDIAAREVGAKLGERWGQQIVVDNRPGAGGLIAHELAARAAPDGYTLVLGSSGGLVILPLMTPRMPYDPVKDFAPVSKVITGAHALVIYPQLPATSVKELIALAKSKPGKLNFASAGVGSATQLSGELFKLAAHIDIVHVPYKGGVAALTDMVAGQVQLMFNSIPPVLPFAKAGRLRILAVSSAKRLAVLPDVPAVAETLPGFQSGVWYAVFAPAGTPRRIVDVLSTAFTQALADPEVARRLTAQGVDPEGSTPEALARFVKEDRARWSKVMTAAHLAK